MQIVRKLLSFILVITLLLTVLPLSIGTTAAKWGFDDPTKEEGGNEEAYTLYNEKEGRLFNLYDKIKNLSAGETLDVAYFGGSITNGSGASDLNTTSWRGIVGNEITNLVKEFHPDSTVTNRVIKPFDEEKFGDGIANEIVINNLNAAIGATGSWYGLFRTHEDLQIEKKPDLLFLEFSYNDYCSDTYTRKYTDANGNNVIAFAVEYESIIREIYRYAPECEIIAIFTAGVTQKNNITENKYPQMAIERNILRLYDIPYLYVGRELMNKIIELDPSAATLDYNNCASNEAWLTYLTDACHPNDKGYKVYADVVSEYINGRIAAAKDFEQNGGTVTIKNGSLENSYFDASVLKNNPKQVLLSEFYEDYPDYLSGFKKFETNKPSTWDRGAISTDFAGSSLAFRFTGDTVGMWIPRTKRGGNLTANIYNVENGERTTLYKTETICVNGSTDLLPVIFDFGGQIPYDTYDVEISVSESEYGAYAKICRIYWNGEDNITPIMHPDIPVVDHYNDIEIMDDFIEYEEKYGITLNKNSDDGSYTFTASTDSENNPFKLVRYSLAHKAASIQNYPYVLVEYYIDENSNHPITNIGMRVRSATGMDLSKIYTMDRQTTEPLEKGKWATAVIDISGYDKETSSMGVTPQSNWRRMEFYPFGYGVTTSTEEMNGASIKIRSVRFSHYSTSIEIEDEENTVFVNSSGLVTLPDTSEYPAYKTFSEAFDALGTKGGTIYFQGAFTEFVDGTKPHGDVKIIGIGDSAVQRTQNKILIPNTSNICLALNGNITFENMSFSYEDTPRITYVQTGGNTITFGKNVATIQSTEKDSNGTYHTLTLGSYVKAGYSGKASNFVFSSSIAEYDSIAAMAGISATYWSKHIGHINYVFNDGNYKKIFAGACNNGSAALIGYGDVNYTFNGGNYLNNNIYTGSFKSGSRFGNTIMTFNGGNIKYNVLFGSEFKGSAETQNPGYYSVIVNCKEITETESGKLSATSEKISFGNVANYDIPEKTMVIINNAELSENAKVEISKECTSQYKIKAFGGKVIPVFNESSLSTNSTSAGEFLGFKFETDSIKAVPYCNGEKIEVGTNGYYQLPKGEIDIIFKDELATVYVSAKGSDDGDGTLNNPYLSISKAIKVIEADNTVTAGKIIIINDNAEGISFSSAPHNKMITIEGIESSIAINGQSNGNWRQTEGPLTFDNISLKNIGFEPRGYELVIKSGVILEGLNNSGRLNIRAGYNTENGEKIYIDANNSDTYNKDAYLYIGNGTVKGDLNIYVNDIYSKGLDIRNATYNGNINLTVNNYRKSVNAGDDIWIGDNAIINGALQVILNNGVSAIHKERFRKIIPQNGSWIIFSEKANDKSILEMTDTVGVYKVKGSMIATAYKVNTTDDSLSKIGIISKNGILNLSTQPGEYIVKYSEAILGDANNDSKTDIRDLVCIKDYIADNTKPIEILNCDFDKDNKVTALDLTALMKKLLNVY